MELARHYDSVRSLGLEVTEEQPDRRALFDELQKLEGVTQVLTMHGERVVDEYRDARPMTKEEKSQANEIMREAVRICELDGNGVTINAVLPFGPVGRFIIEPNFWPLDHENKSKRQKIIDALEKKLKAIPRVGGLMYVQV